MARPDLAEFFGRGPMDPVLPVLQHAFIADLQKLQIYAAHRAAGRLSQDVYGVSGVAGSVLGTSSSVAARIFGALLQIFNFHSMFSPAGHHVNFTCMGHPTITCSTEITR